MSHPLTIRRMTRLCRERPPVSWLGGYGGGLRGSRRGRRGIRGIISPKGDTSGSWAPGADDAADGRWVRAVDLSERDFTNLLEFRTMLRRFERWSEQQARAVGLTPAQHQLLLAVKGHADRRGPTIREIADYLLLRHHSTVELVDRVENGGLVRRRGDPDDARVVRVVLTGDGEDRLARLATMHVEELRRLAPILDHLVEEAE